MVFTGRPARIETKITENTNIICLYFISTSNIEHTIIKAMGRRGVRKTHGTGVRTFEGLSVYTNDYFNIYWKNLRSSVPGPKIRCGSLWGVLYKNYFQYWQIYHYSSTACTADIDNNIIYY